MGDGSGDKRVTDRVMDKKTSPASDPHPSPASPITRFSSI